MSLTIAPAPVRRSIHVKAAPARAFEVFTAGMGRWWPSEHHLNASPLKDAIVEPRVGGRWFERCEDGSECDWGRVLIWEPPTRLVLAWQINAQWKFDPGLMTEVEVKFIADGAGTRVELEHRHLERFGEQAETMRAAFDSADGWSLGLRRFAAAAEAA